MVLRTLVFSALACVPLQSPAPAPVEPNGDSGSPSMSDDGKFVVFDSRASNFVAGDEKDTWDVFLYERATGGVRRIGDEGALPSRWPTISGDGRWIVFLQEQPSRAATLDDGPAPSSSMHPWRVGLHDRRDGSLRWIGEGAASHERKHPWQRPSIARDGSRLVYTARQNGLLVFQCFEGASGKLSVLSLTKDGKVPRVDVRDPAISPNGRYLAFSTCDRTLTPPPKITGESARLGFDDHVEDDHILRRDLQTGENAFVSHLAFNSIGYAEYSSPHVSDDGRFVAYDHNDSRKLGSTHVGFVSDLERQEAGRLLPESHEGGGDWWQGTVTVEWLSSDGRRALVATGNPAVPVVPAEPGAFQVTLRDFEQGTWTLISRASDGSPGNRSSYSGSAAADLSVFAFASEATNLVAGDANHCADVFLFESAPQRTTRIVPSTRVVLAASSSSQPNDGSSSAQIAEDGECVVFASQASNFDEADSGDSWDVFLLTCATGAVLRLSREPHDGVTAPAISGDGKWIAYWSWRVDSSTDGHSTLHLRDRIQGETKIIDDLQPSLFPFSPSAAPSISRDGSRIVFDALGGVKLLERESGATTIVSLDDQGKLTSEGADDPVISGDGNTVAFWSQSAVFAPFPLSQEKSLAPGPYDWHIFVRDLEQQTTRAVDDVLISAGVRGHPCEPRLSEDGTRVACNHDDADIGPYGGFVVDLVRNNPGRLVPRGENVSAPRNLVPITWLSPDGKWVLVSSRGEAFGAKPAALHPQVFLHALESDEWTPVSRSATGQFANRPAEGAVASRDLLRIVFESEADNLVPGDTNNARDLFILERKTGKISRVEAHP